jgi:hypothetical protein
MTQRSVGVETNNGGDIRSAARLGLGGVLIVPALFLIGCYYWLCKMLPIAMDLEP